MVVIVVAAVCLSVWLVGWFSWPWFSNVHAPLTHDNSGFLVFVVVVVVVVFASSEALETQTTNQGYGTNVHYSLGQVRTMLYARVAAFTSTIRTRLESEV